MPELCCIMCTVFCTCYQQHKMHGMFPCKLAGLVRELGRPIWTNLENIGRCHFVLMTLSWQVGKLDSSVPVRRSKWLWPANGVISEGTFLHQIFSGFWNADKNARWGYLIILKRNLTAGADRTRWCNSAQCYFRPEETGYRSTFKSQYAQLLHAMVAHHWMRTSE